MKKKTVIFFILSFLFILCFPHFKNHVLDSDFYFVIRTEGGKCKESNGTEIWLDSILVDDVPYDLSQIPLEGSGWEYTGRLFHSGKEGASLEMKIPFQDKLEMLFVTHPYSGIAEVVHKDQTQEIDLYSVQEGREHRVFQR